MNQHVEFFTRKYGLTPRETEVFHHLVFKANDFKDLPEKLNVSPNTLNNHLKKIFKKTSAHSKGELISMFLVYTLEQEGAAKGVAKKPRVFILDDEQEICSLLEEELKEKGCDVMTSTTTDNVVEKIFDFYPDVVVSDIRMPNEDGVQILKKLRSRSRFYPTVIFVTGYSDYLLEELLDFGGVDLIHKPFEFSQLFEKISKQVIGNRTRDSLTHQDDLVFQTQDYVIDLEETKPGYGGVFVPFRSNHDLTSKINIGQKVALKFKIGEVIRPVKARGEVVWKRDTLKDNLDAGVGIRFVEINEEDESLVKSYVKKNSITSYIPIGRAV